MRRPSGPFQTIGGDFIKVLSKWSVGEADLLQVIRWIVSIPWKKCSSMGSQVRWKKTYLKAPTSCFWTMGSNHRSLYVTIVGPLKLHTVAAGASTKRLAFSETKEAPEIKADIRSSQSIPAVVWNRVWFDFTSEDTDVYTVYDFDRCCGFHLKPNSRTGLPEMGR